MGILLIVIFVCISVTVFVAIISAAAFMGGTAVLKKVIDRIRWMLGIETTRKEDRKDG